LSAPSLFGLLVELLLLQFQLMPLDFKQCGLMPGQLLLVLDLLLYGADLPGLLPEGEASQDGGGEGEYGEASCGHSGQLSREGKRHVRRLWG
jgi:hypothetical protein